MVKCMFLGHSAVFERDLSDKLDAAIAKILHKNSEVEFLFYQRGAFYDLCLMAVLKAQHRYPQKQIRITLVVAHMDDLAYNPIPMCLIDGVLEAPQFPLPKKDHDFTLNHRKTIRWTIEQCSYLISYMYPQIQDERTQHYRFAEQKKLTILDVTDPATTAYMTDWLKERSAREQVIAQRRQEGQTWSQIGAELGISGSMVQANSRFTSRTLIRAAAEHLQMQTGNEIVSCGIFGLGKVTAERTAMFKEVISFLIARYKVTEFKITAESSSSGYMQILEQAARCNPRVRLSIVTHYAEDTPEKWLRERISAHEAFGDSVENIGSGTKRTHRAQMIQVIRWMMSNTDYCISNLPDNPLQKNIETCARKLGGVKLIDIGKNAYIRVCDDE